MPGYARRSAGQLAARMRGAAIGLGLLDYEAATSPPSMEDWERQYEGGDWDYLGDVHQQPHYGVLAAYADHFDHGSILDIGCGFGQLRARLNGVPFERYVGIDPVQGAVDQADRLRDDRTEFRVGDAFLVGLGNFDIVVCNEILYSLPRIGEQLDRIRDLVRVGGHLLTSNVRHPGDRGLYRMLNARFSLIDCVELRNRRYHGNSRRRVAAYQRLN